MSSTGFSVLTQEIKKKLVSCSLFINRNGYSKNNVHMYSTGNPAASVQNCKIQPRLHKIINGHFFAVFCLLLIKQTRQNVENYIVHSSHKDVLFVEKYVNSKATMVDPTMWRLRFFLVVYNYYIIEIKSMYQVEGRGE